MAKKSNNKKMIFIIAAVCGIIAVVMNLLPVLQFHQDLVLEGSYNEVNITGFQLMFGAEECVGKAYSALGIGVDYKISTKLVPMALISGICIVVGIVALLLGQAVGKKNKMMVNVIACLCFVAGAVLCIAFTKSSYVSVNEIGEAVAEYYKPAIGAYLVTGFSGIAGLLALAA